jgi:hypothetical protein
MCIKSSFIPTTTSQAHQNVILRKREKSCEVLKKSRVLTFTVTSSQLYGSRITVN